jgi:hypothetical protein
MITEDQFKQQCLGWFSEGGRMQSSGPILRMMESRLNAQAIAEWSISVASRAH